MFENRDVGTGKYLNVTNIVDNVTDYVTVIIDDSEEASRRKRQSIRRKKIQSLRTMYSRLFSLSF